MKNKSTGIENSNRIPAEYAVLGLLFSGPNHGYQLIRHFASTQALGQIYHLEMNMLYFLLKKLEREELISAHNESSGATRSRRIVEITPRGRAEFLDWIKSPVQKTREIRLEFLLKFYFARRLDPAIALRLVEEQQKINLTLLAKQNDNLKGITNSVEEEMQELIISLRIAQNEAVLSWLVDCRKTLLAQQAQS